MLARLCYKAPVPKVVDHDARRAELARALREVVAREGIHAVSVRSVAAAARTSPSALRHYFSSQDELMAFAYATVVEHVTDRIEPLLPRLRGREGARTILEQYLPLDDATRVETAVYLAFIGRSPGSPELQQIRDRADERALDGVRLAVGLLADAGAVGAGRDLDEEASRLYAVVDGLAMHGSLMPDRYPADHLRTVLERHLADLELPAASRIADAR